MTADSLTKLRSLISQIGLVDAAIKLGRHPIAIERMRDGIDEVTPEVEENLARLGCSQHDA